MDFNQGFAIMHDRCVCTPPSGRNDCSQVQIAGGTLIILTLLRAAVWMCLHDASCGFIVRDRNGQALVRLIRYVWSSTSPFVSRLVRKDE